MIRRRSLNVSAPLLASAALALLTACRRTPEMQRCVDENNRVVEDKFCAGQPALNNGQQGHGSGISPGYYPGYFPGGYRYYYGGGGGYGLGSSVYGGSYNSIPGHSYSSTSGGTTRGGFGGSHGGGGGEGE